jgi:hypothetical protein
MKQRPPATEVHKASDGSLSYEDDALWLINSDVEQVSFMAVTPADLIAIGQRLQALGRKLAKAQTTK